MPRLTSLLKLRVPLGGQEIELQQVDFEAAGGVPTFAGELPDEQAAASEGSEGQGTPATTIPMNMLRTRIREKSRFTVFDVDPLTAEKWGNALTAWASAQRRR